VTLREDILRIVGSHLVLVDNEMELIIAVLNTLRVDHHLMLLCLMSVYQEDLAVRHAWASTAREGPSPCALRLGDLFDGRRRSVVLLGQQHLLPMLSHCYLGSLWIDSC